MKIIFLLSTFVSLSALATSPSMIEGKMDIPNRDKTTIEEAQVGLAEDLRKQCGPHAIRSFDVVDASYGHFEKTPGSLEYQYFVTVKGICR